MSQYTKFKFLNGKSIIVYENKNNTHKHINYVDRTDPIIDFYYDLGNAGLDITYTGKLYISLEKYLYKKVKMKKKRLKKMNQL